MEKEYTLTLFPQMDVPDYVITGVVHSTKKVTVTCANKLQVNNDMYVVCRPFFQCSFFISFIFMFFYNEFSAEAGESRFVDIGQQSK